jgi:aerobic carbon-monoxide dehydrogenase medium subunit
MIHTNDLLQERFQCGERLMIPGSFDYHRPKTAGEAAKLLKKNKESRVLAGGHSLLPMMKLRMAAPTALIDLGDIATMRGIKKVGTKLVIGAMTTQHEILASALIKKHAPILHETAILIADPQVRYVGTIGGNVANGDPGNDMPAVMLALDATYNVTGATASRSIKARAFYKGSYETALKVGEIVTSIEIPALGKHGYSYEKLKRKIGDYATAAAAVVLTNLGPTALLADAAAKALIGTSGDENAVDAAVAAARTIMSPAHDTRGTPQYRTSVGGIYVARAIKAALARA